MNISPSPGAFTAVFIKSQVVFSDFSRPSFSIFLPWLFHEAHSSSETCLPSPPPLQMGFRSTSEWSEKVTLRVSRPQSSVASLACLSRKFSLNLLRKNMIAQACAEGQSLSGTTSVTCPRRSHWPLLISSFYSSSQWKGWHQRPCLP